MPIPIQQVYEEALATSAQDMREEVTSHMATLGLSSKGVGLVLHCIKDEETDEDPESPLAWKEILLYSTKRASNVSDVHVIEKKRVATPLVRSIGQVYTHANISPKNIVRRRTYTELILDTENKTYADNNFNGPTFGYNISRGQIMFYPRQLYCPPHSNPEQADHLPDSMLTMTAKDQISGLFWARSVIALLNIDNQIYGAPAL